MPTARGTLRKEEYCFNGIRRSSTGLERRHFLSARRRLLQMHFESKVGHLGGNLSCLDAMLVVFHEFLRPDDQFVLSKGHSAGALYVSPLDARPAARGGLHVVPQGRHAPRRPPARSRHRRDSFRDRQPRPWALARRRHGLGMRFQGTEHGRVPDVGRRMARRLDLGGADLRRPPQAGQPDGPGRSQRASGLRLDGRDRLDEPAVGEAARLRRRHRRDRRPRRSMRSATRSRAARTADGRGHAHRQGQGRQLSRAPDGVALPAADAKRSTSRRSSRTRRA